MADHSGRFITFGLRWLFFAVLRFNLDMLRLSLHDNLVRLAIDGTIWIVDLDAVVLKELDDFAIALDYSRLLFEQLNLEIFYELAGAVIALGREMLLDQ